MEAFFAKLRNELVAQCSAEFETQVREELSTNPSVSEAAIQLEELPAEQHGNEPNINQRQQWSSNFNIHTGMNTWLTVEGAGA